MEFSVDNLCGFLIRSKLMTPDEMQGMRQRWVSEAKDSSSQVPLFLKWLVTNLYATEYQAALLSRGHADDFFLGHYKILERIGRGHMAGVYKAVHPSGQVVAIKVLPPSRAKNPQVLARFEREARLSVKLKHEHVVRSFQLGEGKNLHYLVMEYLEGETLDEVLQRRKRLPPGEAVRLIYQALVGLQHLHEQGLVHRDLKPANLMLLPAPTRGDNETTLKSNIKILDIGLARELFDENSPEPTTEQMDLTGEGVLLGTPDYLAPEQARDPRAIDIRADIYSLGCVLYHILTGQLPFPDKNILNQMIRHATETAKPLQEYNPSIPDGLQQIVNWMMAKQAKDRYPTPARASQALQAFMMVSSDSTRPPEETPQLRRYLTWLETADKGPDSEAQTLPPTVIPMPPVKLIVPPSAPAPGGKMPVQKKQPAQADARRKNRANAPPGAPAAKPAMPAAAAPPAPVPGGPMGAATMPAMTPLEDEQLDVELVDIPAAPLRKIFSLSWRDMGLRDVYMLIVGAGAITILYGVWTVIALVLSWFRGE